jgi:hypothetical protein
MFASRVFISGIEEYKITLMDRRGVNGKSFCNADRLIIFVAPEIQGWNFYIAFANASAVKFHFR